MSRLDSAFERFNEALNRVEGAMKSNGGAAEDESRLDALRTDRDRLAQQLERVRGDYDRLQSLTGEVETRLDSAIDNIRRVMRG